jgi:hypothetical protein
MAASWRGWRDPRPRLAPVCRRCTHCRPHPVAGVCPPVLGWAGGASRAAVPGWPAGRMTDPVGGLRDARLASRTRGRARPVARTATIRWSPSGRGTGPQDGGVVTRQRRARRNRRAPASGTAVRATTVSGSSTNATRSLTEGVHATGGTIRVASARGEGIRGWGVGDGAPKPNVPDQVDTTGLGRRNALPRGAAPRLPTRSTSTSRLLDLALRTVTSMSSVWTNRGGAFRGTRRAVGPGSYSSSPPRHGYWWMPRTRTRPTS